MEKARGGRRFSIATILITGIVIFSTLLLVALGAIFWNHERASRLRDFHRHSTVAADQLATALSNPLWNFDEEYVTLLVGGLFEDKEVRAVRLERTLGAGISLHRLPDGKLSSDFSGFDQTGVIVERRDIRYQGHSLGRVELYFSTLDLQAANDKSLVFLVGIVFAFNAFLVLGLYALLWRLALRPLRLIEDYAIAVNLGGTGAGLEEERFTGELETVRTSIRRMVGLLRERFAEIAQSERKYHSIFNGTSDAIIVHAVREGTSPPHVVEVNDIACARFGYTRGEMLALSPGDLIVDPAAARAARMAADKGRYIVRLRRKSGEEVPFEIMDQPIEMEGKRYIISAGRDISEREEAERERNRLEEQLRQAHKMEAIGRLAGGIAHDFNNLLTAILGYCEILELDATLAGRHREYIGQVKAASNRAASLTRQLLAFSRKQILQPKLIRLSEIVAETHKIIERILGEDIHLELRSEPDSGHVYADPGQLNQVLMNLTINARDAMPAGGTLTLATANARIGAGETLVGTGAPPGEYVMLTVTDTGVGMDGETIEKLFEPFFTTKGVGKGTGLGLATVHGIVTQSGGHISVQSSPGRGTAFRILFPRRWPEEGIERHTPAEAVGMQRGSETILVVEDSPEVRSLAVSVLANLGYRVHSSDRGIDAERLAAGLEERIDLLLTDVVMPGMSGKVLAERMIRARPGMRVLYMSGYTEDAIVHHGVLEEGIQFIQKPFRPSDLAAKVRETLGGRVGEGLRGGEGTSGASSRSGRP